MADDIETRIAALHQRADAALAKGKRTRRDMDGDGIENERGKKGGGGGAAVSRAQVVATRAKLLTAQNAKRNPADAPGSAAAREEVHDSMWGKVAVAKPLPAGQKDKAVAVVAGFRPPIYPTDGGPTKGDTLVRHDGVNWSNTGKHGANTATNEDSWEFQNKARRLWVTRSGRVVPD